jgi:predicted NBD/HSP70 family sugar kinase
MYVGIDVGGTKTLAAVLNAGGEIVEQERFPTPKNFDEFISNLKLALSSLNHSDFMAGGAGLPGQLDRSNGRIVDMGNLPWKDILIKSELEKICDCPFVIDNDAKMAALSEAMLLKDEYSKVLYVTVSTGIGYGLVVDKKIDDNVGDGGGRSILLEHQGKMMPWEDFASGRALTERYGKRAEDITDSHTWRSISRYLAQGLIELIAITGPEIIVIGGGVGTYFDRFEKLLKEELDKYKLPMLSMPKLARAQRPEEAVIFGCYDLAKQVLGHG